MDVMDQEEEATKKWPGDDSKMYWRSDAEGRPHHKIWQTNRSEENTGRSYCEIKSSSEECQTNWKKGTHETGQEVYVDPKETIEKQEKWIIKYK